MYPGERLRATASLFVVATVVALTFAPIPGNAASPGTQRPIPGSGAAGAVGPRVGRSLAPSSGGLPVGPAAARPPAPRTSGPATPLQLPPWTQHVFSSDANVTDAALGAAPDTSGTAPKRPPSGSFTAPWMIDVAGTTDGRRILVPDINNQVAVYDMGGNQKAATDRSTFWCGPNPLPICSAGGFAVDVRALYDPGAGRWVITAMQTFCTGCNAPCSPCSATSLLAVSQSADPTLGWYLYQYPQCGAFDTWDTGDQPHSGFSSKWILVAGACSASGQGTNGAGLAVFDKAQLYAGTPLALNQNWFEFVDPWAGGPYSRIGGGGCTRDNPAATYAPTPNDRAYLVVSAFSCVANATTVPVVYSYVEGPTDAPAYVPSALAVTPGFAVNSPPAVDAPGCTGCMTALDNTWIHSSGVYALANGTPTLVSTMVLGDPGYQRATQVIGVATNLQTGAATALQLSGGKDGAGAMAAEIAMPLSSGNKALIVYDYSDSGFYPGVKSASWNIGPNTTKAGSVNQPGTLTPPAGSFERGRWNDFIDALVPIPGSPSLLLGATLAVPSVNSQYASTYWTAAQP